MVCVVLSISLQTGTTFDFIRLCIPKAQLPSQRWFERMNGVCACVCVLSAAQKIQTLTLPPTTLHGSWREEEHRAGGGHEGDAILGRMGHPTKERVWPPGLRVTRDDLRQNFLSNGMSLWPGQRLASLPRRD